MSRERDEPHPRVSSGNSSIGLTCWKPALGDTASRRPKRSTGAAAIASWLPERAVRSACEGREWGVLFVGVLEIDRS